MSTKITGQRELELKSEDRMGVASPSTKRRLGSHEDDEVVSAKIARKLNNNNNDITLSLQDTSGNENSSDFLTTSILARTLLTTSSSGVGINPHHVVGVGGSLCPASYALTPDPLESLKSSLEALPAPDIRPFFLSDKSTILSDPSDLEFSGLLCHERPLELASSVITVLSPIDTESSPSKSSSSSAFGSSQHNQLITEDENGKSYFNLGSSDATIVARKSSRSSLDHVNSGGWNNCSTNLHGNLLNGSNSNSSSNDFDDNASSSSCESISSEDLFNSGEEFDASDDDEDELCSYKQQRSTVLHLSLCKLNKFRSVSKQQCVEPSLHRSVLICNTLRHIEQEIKNEDEVDESLKSREKLPSFWRSTSNHCFSNSNNNPTPPSHQQPQITDSRPNNPAANNPNGSPMNPSNGLLSPGGHDPYLSSPNPYSEAPYLSYDYNSLRPTPYHTTSYEYGEHDLPSSNNASPASQQLQQTSSSEIIGTSSSSTLLECDSGYGDDLDLSSYYYAPPPPPPSVQSPIMTSLIAPPPPTQMETSCSPTDFGTSPAVSQAVSQVASNNNSSISSSGCNSSNPSNSSSTSSNNSSSSSSSGSGGNVSPPHNHNNANAAAAAAYLHCGFTSTLANASSSPTPGAISDNDPSALVLMSGGEIDSLAKSDLSDSRSSTSPESSPNSMNGCHPNRSPPHGSTLTSSSNPSACDYLGRDFSSDNVGQSSMDMGRQPGDQDCWSSKSGKDLLGVASSPNGGGGTVVVPATSSLPSAGGNNNNNNNNNVAFAQQESQCGIESRRSELSISSNHFSNHNLPMENLISSTYSSSL